MRTRSRRDPAAEDTETVARVREALQGYAAETGPDGMVLIRNVLDLLNPRGMWSYDPGCLKAQSAPGTAAGPWKDPLTGARWAGAPGTAPPQ
jgi:hypothetical protein